MKNKNYITILGWMVNELSLSGNDLICYAVIYGFSQDDNFWEGSQSYLSDWLGVSRRTVIDILKRLISNGLIAKQEYEVNNVKFCKYKAIVPNTIWCEDSAHGGSEDFAHDNNNKSKNKEEKDKSFSKKDANADVDEFVDRMYALYPAKCPKRGAYLGKSKKDKAKIKSLLKTYSESDIEFVIRWEIAQKYNKAYMLNFSTFLNNFPDPTQIEGYNELTNTSTNTLPKGWTQERYDMYIRNGYTITEDGRLFKDGKEYK